MQDKLFKVIGVDENDDVHTYETDSRERAERVHRRFVTEMESAAFFEAGLPY
jgi:hypothetical protein